LSDELIAAASHQNDVEHELIGFHLQAMALFDLRNVQEAWVSSQQAVTRLKQINYIESPQISAAAIYYWHSRIAGALGQRDTSLSYLKKAYADILRKADLIADEQVRWNFLNNITLNEEIVAAGSQL
jgi:hypothetical protein